MCRMILRKGYGEKALARGFGPVAAPEIFSGRGAPRGQKSQNLPKMADFDHFFS